MDLAIIIINYKTPHLTVSVLESLISEVDISVMKVVVIDNDSRDDSLLILDKWLKENAANSWVNLIASNINKGFSGGNNLGIQSVKAKNYLLLNSDTTVRPGAIRLLLETANKHPEAGLISPRLESTSGKAQESCFRFHTPISEFINSASTSLITKAFRKYVVAQPVKDYSDYYQWTSFACILIKAEVIEQIGLLDEKFFMYYEDVEFSFRALKAGWKVLNNPEAHVVHLRGGSSPVKSQTKLRKRVPRYFYESRTLYFYKLYGQSGLLSANILWSLGAFIAFIRSLLSNKYKSKIVAKQWQDNWINYLNPTKPYTHPDDYDQT
ncbi:MAG: family 2 glycosyl transferase [Methylophaga sp.]|nr:family 2 glycosyl transferase [Methylophaga sp.]MAY18347.1 family 2 glycosyl transferase [Methylophaga sp.]HCD05814.1 glycosyltransferase family 2 protein [Methylophaga sp.]